jgi:chemotaxis protein MotB
MNFTRDRVTVASHLVLDKSSTVLTYMRRLFALGGALSLCTACVRASVHDALKAKAQAERVDLETRLKQAMTRGEELSASGEQLSDRVDALSKELAQCELKSATLLKDQSKLQGSIEEMQAALSEQRRRQAEVEARISSFKSLLNRFRPLIDTGKLKVKIADGRMVLVLATDILFDQGSARLSEAGESAISEVAQVLANFPQRAFQVEGHTDNDPISTKRYPSNWELAADRSITVVKTMINNGLPPTQISASSYGAQRPTADNSTAEEKSQNRRIEIVILPDLSLLPGFDELQNINPDTPSPSL